MDKFEKLFAEYPCTLTDELVKENTADILAKHTEENNTREVWMQCLHQIDLTTLNGEDTTAKVAQMAGAGRLLIGHFSSRYKDLEALLAECREMFPSTDIARERETFLIEPKATKL